MGGSGIAVVCLLTDFPFGEVERLRHGFLLLEVSRARIREDYTLTGEMVSDRNE